MADLYEGEADGRQSLSDQASDLFRKRYRQLTTEEVALHDAIKDKAAELAALIGQIKVFPKMEPIAAPTDGTFSEAIVGHAITPFPMPFNHQCLAITHLEDAVYRAVKALTS